CEEAGILPELAVTISEIAKDRFRVIIQDNGPGIVKPQMPKIFAKLLYGSKFHRLKQSRGQQGIGISAAALYGQLTTGKPVVITSKTGKGRPAYRIELRIDTKRNQPDIVSEAVVDWPDVEHGTKVELELQAAYRGGRTGVDSYLEQTVVANPHLGLTFQPPKGDAVVYPRASNELPREAQEVKPHPHGVELGMLQMMLQDAEGETIKHVLTDRFARVSSAIADQMCRSAKLDPKMRAGSVHGDALDRLHTALGAVKVLAPSASSVVPIGAELLEVGLRRRYPNAEFFVSATRPPSVYRGNPFVVEVGLAYGDPTMVPDEPADVMRFANRVPLQYQPKACAISESVYDTNWRNYGLTQPKGSLPHGSLAICVHLASVWVPFTSEAKEAVAHYEELLREMKLAVQECGRRLGSFLRAREKAQSEHKRLGIFQKYIPEVATALGALLGLDRKPIEASFQAALTNFVRIAAAEEPAEEEGLPRVPSMPPPPDDAERPISEAPKALASKAVVTKGEPSAKSAKGAKAEKPAKATEPSPKASAPKAPAPKALAAKAPKPKTTAKAPPAPKKPAKKSAPKKKGAR
ncbi:MAG: DNA topoisomerase VI subunit B, partial [Proteobacteria bacterium]